MALHPDSQRIIDEVESLGPMPAPGQISPEEMRRGALEAWKRTDPEEPVGAVYDRTVPGPAGDIPVRVYLPKAEGPFPLVVWCHGGGWVIGGPDENEGACRALCRRAEAVVVSVTYRLAPEDRFPAAVEDAYAVMEWAAENGGELAGDTSRIAVAGESAGGNLAAVCALMARDRGGPPLALQLLVAPIAGRPDDGRPSYSDFAEGYFLTRASMEWFFEQYPRSPEDLDDPYLVPLAATDLSGLAPALVMTSEYDVLRDEGEEYARRLSEAGVPCELERYDGHIHGFFGLLDQRMEVSAAAHERAAVALRAAFSKEPQAAI